MLHDVLGGYGYQLDFLIDIGLSLLAGFLICAERESRGNGWAQVTELKIQVKHMDHLFRVYIKSMGLKSLAVLQESVLTLLNQ